MAEILPHICKLSSKVSVRSTSLANLPAFSKNDEYTGILQVQNYERQNVMRVHRGARKRSETV